MSTVLNRAPGTFAQFEENQVSASTTAQQNVFTVQQIQPKIFAGAHIDKFEGCTFNINIFCDRSKIARLNEKCFSRSEGLVLLMPVNSSVLPYRSLYYAWRRRTALSVLWQCSSRPAFSRTLQSPRRLRLQNYFFSSSDQFGFRCVSFRLAIFIQRLSCFGFGIDVLNNSLKKVPQIWSNDKGLRQPSI